jgi:hypothetical protein
MAELGKKYILHGRIKSSENFNENFIDVFVTLITQQRFIIFLTILRQSIEKCLLYSGK